jgi:tetratricopeptide (TPR) repeat protein
LLLATLLTFFLVTGAPASNNDGYGQVAFANSGSTTAQKDFLNGLALLHDFEYRSAALAFQRAQSTDPGFAMAYWGEAMTFNHPLWMRQDLKAGRAALNKLASNAAERRAKAKTDREKEYLDAVEILFGEGSKLERDLRYMDAMARLHARYPQDVDAIAFYGLAILGTAHEGRNIATYMRAAGILEGAWKDNQDHPGLLHYLIHSYDDPTHAPLGLRAARLYAKIAPNAGHAQHMTSHIFLALGMWPETVDSNIAAIAAADREEKGNNSSRCGHYPSWLEYAYLQLGQIDKARATLTTCRGTLESLESKTPMGHGGHPMNAGENLSGAFANMLLRYLIDSGDWNGQIAQWPLPKNAGPDAKLDFAFARVMSEIMKKDNSAARQALAELESKAKEVKDIETKKADADPTFRVRPDVLVLEARGLLAEQENDFAGAEKLLRQAVALEETLPIAFGPPTIDKPTHELLGEFLLRRGRKDEARAQLERALARTPGRRQLLTLLSSSKS